MPDDRTTGGDIVRRRSPEWVEHVNDWRRLLDSLEGGRRYREAVYGYDSRGLPIRNLLRHKRELPDARDGGQAAARNAAWYGQDAYTLATDDDYETRRARTPVPTFVQESVENDIGQIFAGEVKRKGTPELEAFWRDVDGRGASIDDWMRDTVAPLLLTLGCLDLCFDHPARPDGEAVETRADVERLGLGRCVADVILPENMVWWRLDATDRRYEECLVQECYTDYEAEPSGRERYRYRHWTDAAWTLYDDKGAVLDSGEHAFGRVPIVRVFDQKKFRCKNVGQSRQEAVAELQREFYNRDSELILSDTLHAHPVLQGPDDYINGDGTIPVGPSWLLPKKKSTTGGSPTYEGFEYLSPDKSPDDSLRLNLSNIRERVDRAAKMFRTGGSEAIAKGTIEQSAVSKSIDYKPAHDRLSKIAKAFQRAELAVAEFALVVLADGRVPDVSGVEVAYPQSYALYSASEAAVAATDFLVIAGMTGNPGMEDAEVMLLKRQYRLSYPGLTDAEYATADSNIEEFVQSGGGQAVAMKKAEAQAAMKMQPAGNVRSVSSNAAEPITKPNTPAKPTPVDESSSG